MEDFSDFILRAKTTILQTVIGGIVFADDVAITTQTEQHL
jgi:hypothetical protein